MVEESHVARVMEMVWNATLRLSIGPWDASIVRPDIRSMLAAYVKITGSWGGTVCVHAPLLVARQAAAIMFNISQDAVTEMHVQDAFGELANQVGGNLKALLPGTCRLSLPAVVDGNAFLATLPDSDMLLDFVAESGGMPVMVTMVELLPSREAFQARFSGMSESPE